MTARSRLWLRATRAPGLLLGFAVALCVVAESTAFAEKFPSHPIRIIVPFEPGGSTDVIAHLIADRLATTLGQHLVVENHPGGDAGAVGLKVAADAAPDGYTLLFGSPSPLAIGPTIYPHADYDPAKRFAPVALIATSPQVLVVNPHVPAKSVHDFVAYAKANPGKIKFASPGFGTEPHLLGELLKATAGINIVHVPYKASTRAIADLAAGHVQMLFDGPAVIAPQIAAGRLRALAVASEARTPLIAEVPTMIESGFGRFIANYWAAVAAPSGTPDKIVGRLNAAINDALRTSDVQAALAKLGADAKIGSPQDAATFIAAESAKWAVVAKAAGVKAAGVTPTGLIADP